MDALTFIVEITRTLVWPLSVVVIALLFRKQLISLLQAVRAAVLEAWLHLEDQAIDLALKRGLTNATAHRYAPGAIQGTRKSGLLKPNHLRLLDELQDLRNRAIHDPDFSPDPSSVISYIRLVTDLGHELEALTPRAYTCS